MGILTKEVEVVTTGKMIKYYQEKGYDAKWRQPLIVKVEDLPLNSAVLIESDCDYCGKPKPLTTYESYNAQTKNGTEECCCADCAYLKREEAMNKKYGYKYAMQNPEKKEQIQKTNLDRYGSISPAGNSEVREKQKKTNLERYGVDNPIKSKDIQEKIKQTNLERYGVENVYSSNIIREKIKQTNLERYGVEHVWENKEIINKRNDTLINKYGTIYPLQNEQCLEKLKQTNMKRYGVEHVSQLEEIKEKVKQTNLEKYGYENYMQNPELLEKWFRNNGPNFVKSSAQQCYLCNLYGGILNYPFKCYALDIYLPDEKLDIEFDGSGHKMSVSIGSITEEDFEKKELYRNVAVKKSGIKQIRIISVKDLLPSDSILLQMLKHAKEYFSKYPDRSWIEFNIDSSTVRNAEQKEGSYFNFGKLRKIDKSNLPKEIASEKLDSSNCA